LVNDMKSDLTEPEFKQVVEELARAFAGKKFRSIKLSHWRRH